MMRVHTEPESTAVSVRVGGPRVALAVVSVFVLLACGTAANASAAAAVHAITPKLCGFSSRISAAEDPLGSLSGTNIMKAMASPAAFVRKLKLGFATMAKEQPAVEHAAPKSLHRDFVTLYGVLHKLLAALDKSNNIVVLATEAPKLEAQARSAAVVRAEHAIKAWFTHHC